jgi:hypothetical protein
MKDKRGTHMGYRVIEALLSSDVQPTPVVPAVPDNGESLEQATNVSRRTQSTTTTPLSLPKPKGTVPGPFPAVPSLSASSTSSIALAQLPPPTPPRDMDVNVTAVTGHRRRGMSAGKRRSEDALMGRL